MPATSRVFPVQSLRLAAATFLLVVAGGLALAVNAAPPHGGHGMPMTMMGGGGHIEHMLNAVNASPEQRTQIRSIMEAARNDLKAQRATQRSLHEQAMTLFTQPTVDARAAETLRQQMLAQHDVASQRMLQAMLDVSRVLSPEQRQQLAARMAERRAAMERRRAESADKSKP